MPLTSYGVLKGKAIEVRLGAGSSPHYQVRLIDDTTDYRIATNVKSQLPPSDVEYLVSERFAHPITASVEELPTGFTPLPSRPGTGAMDFIRGNLFDRTQMKPLPFSVPGFDNDLNEKIDRIMQRAVGDETALVYAFGERWGPEPGKKDKYFGFLPGNGIHDIHMNQGNSGRFVDDDGVYQDGAVLVHFPDQHEWVGIFLKFQSQSWHTDDRTGHRIGAEEPKPSTPPGPPPPPEPPTSEEPHGLVRIVAALVNAVQSPEQEVVTLLNTAPHDVALDGWALLDTQKARIPLSGTITAGGTTTIRLRPPLALSNKGGIITLIDDNGLKVDGVAYTREQARNPGWSLVF
ncbi:MAG: DUF2278 family protein [Actinobacteria bacterium]|nr:DUF2278 family protein [Actinomycetota bacterium]